MTSLKDIGTSTVCGDLKYSCNLRDQSSRQGARYHKIAKTEAKRLILWKHIPELAPLESQSPKIAGWIDLMH